MDEPLFLDAEDVLTMSVAEGRIEKAAIAAQLERIARMLDGT